MNQTEQGHYIADTGTIAAGRFQLRYRIEGTGRPAIAIGSAVQGPRLFSPQLRQHLRLDDCVAIEHRQRPALGGEPVRALGEELRRRLPEALRRLPVPDVHVADQAGLVELTAAGDQRRGQRDADAAADVA